MRYYQIGGLYFSWDDSTAAVEPGGFTELFRVDEQDIPREAVRIAYRAKPWPLEKYLALEPLERTGLYELYDTSDGMLLVYHWAVCRFAYGYFYRSLKSNPVEILVNPELPKAYPLKQDRFFSTVGMHTKILQEGGMVLHASYIDRNGEGVLFTAPSQTGKSTQARLWKAYAGAEIINGDRVLLRKKEGRWHCYGYPCCGSSDICLNRTLPLKAVVILEQSPENKIVPMRAGEKIRALVAATEVYIWSEEELEEAFALAERLTADVSVIRLKCRPDKDAVELLDAYLDEA